MLRREGFPLRKVTRNQLRKWVIGLGCTLSVALLFQQARASETFQAAATGEKSQIEQQDVTSQDNVMKDWSNQSRSHDRQSYQPTDEQSNRSNSNSDNNSGLRSRTRQS
jgi:P2-related tail formation protein